MSLFLISALRAILEMLGLCLLGQGVLYLIAGRQRAGNRVYHPVPNFPTAAPKRGSIFLPASTNGALVGIFTFAIVLLLWLGLAFIRKFV